MRLLTWTVYFGGLLVLAAPVVCSKPSQATTAAPAAHSVTPDLNHGRPMSHAVRELCDSQIQQSAKFHRSVRNLSLGKQHWSEFSE
jgi:hypothetical protein